jgi:hypothetical protein
MNEPALAAIPAAIVVGLLFIVATALAASLLGHGGSVGSYGEGRFELPPAAE